MAKEVFSFRLTEEDVQNLDKLAAHWTERAKVLAEKWNLTPMEYSRAVMISQLINEEFKRLEKEGYNL